MRKDRESALQLRLQGYSYAEIQQKLNIAKSTLSSWLSGVVLSSEAQAKINAKSRESSRHGLLKKNKLQTHEARQRARNIRSQSAKEINNLSPRELLLVGAALYWGEGYKKAVTRDGKTLTSHAISLSNSDPDLSHIFIQFLKNVVKIPVQNIRGSIRIYKHINEERALDYWYKTTGIPHENFEKYYYGVSKSSQGKRPYNRLPYGTLQVRVNSTQNFHRIMGWIEGIKSSLK